MSAMRVTRKETNDQQINTRARAKKGQLESSLKNSWTASPSPSGKKRSTEDSLRNISTMKATPSKSAMKRKSGEDGTKTKRRRKTTTSDKSSSFSRSKKKKSHGLLDSLSGSVGTTQDKIQDMSELVCLVKINHCDTTPKNSSIAVDLPQKTPKQSSKHLVSPERSMETLRLSESPRNPSLGIETPKVLQKYSMPMSERKLLSSGKSKSKRSSIDTKHVLRRFSKSPKIVLRSPKPKSKSKSKSTSPKKLKVTKKGFYSKDVGKRRSSGGSPKKSLDSADKKTGRQSKSMEGEVPKGVPLPGNLANKSLSFIRQYEDILQKTPVVLLQRISPTSKASFLRSNVKDVQEATPKKKSPGDRMSRKRGEQTEGTLKPTEPLMSSTPHDEKKRSLRDSSAKETKASLNRSRLNQSASTTSSIVAKTPTVPQLKVDGGSIEDESEPSFREVDMDTSNTQNTYEPDTPIRRNSSRLRNELTITLEDIQKLNEKNVTYELSEPKTPHLREKQRKRSFHEANVVKQSPKKEIPFKTPTIKSAIRMSSVSKEMKKSTQTPASLPRKRQSGKFSKSSGPMATPAKKAPSPLGRRSTTFSSSKKNSPLSIRKQPVSGSKYLASKKPPNFTEIHKKLFSKAESIIDAKKRLEDRHQTFTRLQVQSEKPKSVPVTRPPKHTYSRFGFKLRKSDAMERIMGKRTLLAKEKQKQETREILKGVRMNRRFELQMQARKTAP